MNKEKLSISLPAGLVQFLAAYQIAHAYNNRSEVISDAIKLLQQKELEQCYLEASKEIEKDIDLDATVADGLNDETW